MFEKKIGKISLSKPHGRFSKNAFSLEMPHQKSYSQWAFLWELGSQQYLLLSHLLRILGLGIQFVIARHFTFAQLVFCIKPKLPSKTGKENIANH